MKRVAFIFPGQGSQNLGMGKDFFEQSKLARELFEKASIRLDIDFEDICFKENPLLNQTEYAQPAILLVSLIALKLFSIENNTTPILALGHSLGEFGALVAANALNELDAIELVNIRGKLMQEACGELEAGMMVLLGIEDKKAEEICENRQKEGLKIWCANYNQDGQIVIAGIKKDLEATQKEFLENGAKKALLLAMSVASHCSLLEPAKDRLRLELEKRIKDSFIIPVISNVTASKYSSKNEAIELLTKQLVSPVLYKQSIKAIEDEVDLFIEFGGSVLKGLNKKITQKPTYSITDIKSLQEALEILKGV